MIKKINVRKLALFCLLGHAIAAAIILAIHLHALHQPILVSYINNNEPYILQIKPGTSIGTISNTLHRDKLIDNPRILRWAAIYYGVDKKLQAGEYTIQNGLTPKQLLNNIVNGKVTQYAFTIVEGWNINKLLEEISKHPKVKQTEFSQTINNLQQKLNTTQNIEGHFYPDTYFFPAQTKDYLILKQAHNKMQRFLEQQYITRNSECAIDSSYQALILASIIEKESALPSELNNISGVYHRRLAIGMRLQADPTVIYALGNNVPGKKLKRKHLNIDSPYNTYKYKGLPPTPIAIPSKAAIIAALNPVDSDNLYFVANGFGGHTFSTNLEDHNKAVDVFKKLIVNANIN